jgi:hypothetical protein
MFSVQNGQLYNLPPGGLHLMDALKVFHQITINQAKSILIHFGFAINQEKADWVISKMQQSGIISIQKEEQLVLTDGFFIKLLPSIPSLIYLYLSLSTDVTQLYKASKMGSVDTVAVLNHGSRVQEIAMFDIKDDESENKIAYYLFERQNTPFIEPVILLVGFTAKKAESIAKENRHAVVYYTNRNNVSPARVEIE